MRRGGDKIDPRRRARVRRKWEMPPRRLPLSPFLVGAALLRVALIAYSVWHDHVMEVRYTDIDYDVFTDGAELVLQGQSPFARSTYRYTPLLALALVPSAAWFVAFGKFVFAACDISVGAQVHAILVARQVPMELALRCSCFWLFNPLSLNVSTRGNFESAVAALLLGAVHALLYRRVGASALLLALAVHLKPYPVIYLPAFLRALDGAQHGFSHTARAAFVSAFALTSAGLAIACWLWCGDDYFREALLYHVSRQDVRHNFSPYFLPLYLAPPGTPTRHALGALAFVPQAVLLLVAAWRLGHDLPFCMLIQTLIFVTFNKVCTAQYFIWYVSLLPLCVPSSAMLLRANRKRSVAVAVTWVVALFGWLGCAYLLEFRGQNVFEPLWLASIAFFVANVALILEVIRQHNSTPLFCGQRRVPQKCCMLASGHVSDRKGT